MTKVFLDLLCVLLIAVFLYAVIDCFSRRRSGERRTALIGWTGLVLTLFALNPGSRLFSLPAALILAILVWRKRRGRHPFADDPPLLLLLFCTPASVALAGGIAAVMVALFLYTLGLLQSDEYWQRQSLLAALEMLAAAFIFGALVGLARKQIRARFSRPVFTPYTFAPGSDGVRTREGQGFTVDELILPIAATPFLWYGLAQIHSGWSALFLFGILVLPSFGFYWLWMFFQNAWLGWIGAVNEKDRAVFQAYEVLLKSQNVQPWLGDLIIDYDPAAHRYQVRGTLPGNEVLATVRQRLAEIGGAEVSTEIHIDPQLIPNPWYQLALQKRSRARYL